MNTFMGYKRNDGRIGVRNYIIVLPTVSCANAVADNISKAVDGVIALPHGHGCGRFPEIEMHTQTLAGIASNPNIYGVLVIGLGCETILAQKLVPLIEISGKPVESLIIQEDGGSRSTTEKGIRIVQEMLADSKKIKREPFPFSDLMIGLECGGSDALSGVTANPSIGLLSDWVVEQGGTTILTETTEMIGTEEILREKARCPQVAEDIVKIVKRTESEVVSVLGDVASRIISPGNMDGGMSTIQEKALGCIRKGGSSPINEVLEYGASPTKRGHLLMNGPGYDVESLSGLVAAGCQILVFSTGRGNPIGFPTAPVIKVASNSKLFKSMNDDMDINAGSIIDGRELSDVGNELVDLVKNVASGQQTKAELNKQSGILCLYSHSRSF